MKRILFFATIVATFVLASCQKEESFKDKSEDALVFTASIDNAGTKTTINTDGTSADKGKVSWEVGDEITVSDGTTEATYYIEKIGDIKSDGSATFTFKEGGELSKTASYTASYGTAISTPQDYVATAGKLPMSGVSDSENRMKLNFTVTCSLLKLTLTAGTETDKSISKIEIFGTSGDPSTNVIYTLNCSTAQSIESAKDFYVALPSGSYSVMKFTNSTGHICYKTAKSAMVIANNQIQPVTLTGIVFNDLLPGKFSVSGTKKVRFSKGNLQAYINTSGSPTSWKFAANQYDYIGNAVANNSIGNTAGYIDLFGWSTDGNGATDGYKSWGINTSTTTTDYAGDFVDWGTNSALISALGSDWCTLSSAEWEYLLERENKSKYGYATVADKTGLIILPDDFIDPKTNGGSGAFIPEPGDYQYHWNDNIYNSGGNWEAMESAGAVFLPAAGERYGSGITLIGDGGRYWSSTPEDDEFVWDFNFDYHEALVGTNMREYGCSVRLVR